MAALRRKTILTVGGLDPAGCAGISADSNMIQALGGHSFSIASALTVQTPSRAQQSQATSNGLVAAQLRTICSESPPDATKVGVIKDGRHWFLLKRYLSAETPLVIDPVLKASSGLSLGKHNRQWSRGFSQLAERASLVTPNTDEWATLKPLVPNSTAVLVTGEKAAGTIENKLYLQGQLVETFRTEAQNGEYRGTGCRLSSAIAYYLAEGHSLPQAITKAMQALEQAIKQHYLVGNTAVPTTYLPEKA